MDFSIIDQHLLAHAGASKAWQPAWGWMCYWVGGKQFACEFTTGPDAKAPYAGRHLLSLKCDPAWGAALREEYPGAVLPAYYSDGRTWISIDLDRVDGGKGADADPNTTAGEKDAPDAVLPLSLVLELCDHSYELVFAKLTKKLQHEIAKCG